MTLRQLESNLFAASDRYNAARMGLKQATPDFDKWEKNNGRNGLRLCGADEYRRMQQEVKALRRAVRHAECAVLNYQEPVC